MTAGPVLIVDPGSFVASGAPILLNAIEHTFDMGGFWIVPQIPAKDTGSCYNLRLPRGKYTGFDSPTHTISGMYDNSGRSYKHSKWTSLATEGYYMLTGSMLTGLMLTGSQLGLIDDEINNIDVHSGGTGSLVYVVPTALRKSRNPRSQSSVGSVGYIIDYSFTFKEVQV